MAAKIIFALIGVVFLIQTIASQNCGCSDLGNLGLVGNYGSYGNGYGLTSGIGTYGSSYVNGNIGNYGYSGNYASGNFASGGSFPVASSSPISATGISIKSENVIEGPLCVSGNLPLLAAVILEGEVPSCGQVGVQYGCGNGDVAINSDNSGSLSAGLAGSGLAGQSLAGQGCGCGY